MLRGGQPKSLTALSFFFFCWALGIGLDAVPPLPSWLPIREKIQNEILLEAEQGFICPECGKVLRSAITLKRHILDLHRVQTEQFWCDICRKCYRTKNSLVVHLCKYHQKNKIPMS